MSDVNNAVIVNVRTFGKKSFSYQVMVNGAVVKQIERLPLKSGWKEQVNDYLRFRVPAFKQMPTDFTFERFAVANDIPLFVVQSKVKTPAELKF